MGEAGELGGVRDRDRLRLERVSSNSCAARRFSAVVLRPMATACSAATRRASTSAFAARSCKDANSGSPIDSSTGVAWRATGWVRSPRLVTLISNGVVVRSGTAAPGLGRRRGRGVKNVLRLGVGHGWSRTLTPPAGAVGIEVVSSYVVTNLSLTNLRYHQERREPHFSFRLRARFLLTRSLGKSLSLSPPARPPGPAGEPITVVPQKPKAGLGPAEHHPPTSGAVRGGVQQRGRLHRAEGRPPGVADHV